MKKEKTASKNEGINKRDAILLLVIAVVALGILVVFLNIKSKGENIKGSLDLLSIIKTMLISIVPVIELRGAIPIAVNVYHMPYVWAFLFSYIGNCIIIPPVILLTRTVIDWLKKHIKFLEKLVTRFENSILKKGQKALKYAEIGLLLFVAIPLPGTGAWTGAMIAGLLDIRLRNATPIIAVGVLVASIFVMTLTNVAGMM